MGLFSKKSNSANLVGQNSVGSNVVTSVTVHPVSSGQVLVSSGTGIGTNNISQFPALTPPPQGGLVGGHSSNYINSNQWNNVSLGTAMYSGASIAPNTTYVSGEYFKLFIDEIYSEKSESFRNQILDIFRNKEFIHIHNAITNIFSDNGLEFLKDMTDEEIIHYLRITV